MSVQVWDKGVGNVFEVTIRVLGGLLSGYGLSGDIRLLGAAECIGLSYIAGLAF